MNPFNLRHLPLDPAFRVLSKNGEKLVTIDYPRDKKIVLATLLIVLVPL